jgi:Flp pilus assembly protein TadD
MKRDAVSDWVNRARSIAQTGDLAGARKVMEEALRAYPSEPMLANMAGELVMQLGDVTAARDHFSEACRHAPDNLDYVINHAIALQRLGRPLEAITALKPIEQAGSRLPKYCSVRAGCAREAGDPAEAAKWYDAALVANAQHAKALHGRARVALERGEGGAVARFDAALAVNPGEADLWLGKAQALEVAGDIAGARTIAEQVAVQAPGFIANLTFLSGLRLASGDPEFTRPFAEAAARAPQDPNIAAIHAETLAGLDHAARAAEIAAQARMRFPNEPHFALLEAVHAGSAGEWDRAEEIFADLQIDSPVGALHEARHRLRGRDTGRALQLLERALDSNPWDISAWALRGIAWRLADDERGAWLHEQAGLVQFRPLAGREGLIEDVIAELRALHAGSSMPLGQSLRGGTQTRGILFHRTEPLLAELHQAICDTLEEYRADLAAKDASHPLLRHRDTPWRLAGSWSVRLTGAEGKSGDYHTAHIHPQGIISSALYLIVPEAARDEEAKEGWLEVGRPPPDLRMDLGPLQTIQPKPGHLALFPSTLYHGTTPFGSAERMTVAFDVVTAHEMT